MALALLKMIWDHFKYVLSSGMIQCEALLSKTFGTHIITCGRINAEMSRYRIVGSNKCPVGRPNEWIGRPARKLTGSSLTYLVDQFTFGPIVTWSIPVKIHFVDWFSFSATNKKDRSCKVKSIRSTNQQPGSKFFLLFDVFCKEFYIYHL